MKKFAFFKSKRTKIADRIFLCFLILEIVAILCIAIIAYTLSANNIKDITLSQAQEIINQLSLHLSYQMETVCSMAENLSYNSDIQDILRVSPNISKEFRNMQITAERSMVVDYSSTKFGVIEIFGESGLLLSVPSGRSSILQKEQLDYFKAMAEDEDGRIIWVNSALDDGKLHLFKIIKDLDSMQDLGLLHISLRTDYLKQLFSTVDFSANGEIVLFDADMNAVVGTDEAVVRAKKALEYDSLVIEEGRNTSLILWSYQKQHFLCVCGIIPQYELFSSLQHIRTIIVASVVILIFLSLTLSRRVSNAIVRPLQEMVDPMKEIAMGNFDIKLSVDSNDEIGQLRAGFNIMTEKIKALFIDVYKSELLKKEAEFKRLQAQINPHFLYNTLNTIFWMAKLNNINDIADMTQAVSHLMRASINNKKDIVTVDEEIKLIEDYLLIQKTRYRKRIFSLIEIPAEIRKLMIPKFLLQPLVENAIEHGLERKKDQGYVYIGAQRENDLIIFEVSDNGIGIPKEKIAVLFEKEDCGSDNEHTGLGLKIIHNRIQYIFGNEYGLEIQSEEARGTTVKIKLPYAMCNDNLITRFGRKELDDGKGLDCRR